MEFVENAREFLGVYSFFIVILFGILHGMTDNPWSFLTMTLSLTLLPLPIGYLVLLSSNYLGSVIQYYGLHYLNKRSDNYFYQKRVSKKVLVWLEKQPLWKHIIVIGMPLVPTVSLRIALPFTTITFKHYMKIIIGAYLFLYGSYSLFYFGALSFLDGKISEPVGVALLALFCALVYFGKTIRERLFTNKLKEEVEYEH